MVKQIFAIVKNINNLTFTQQFKLTRNTRFRQKLERLLRTTTVQRSIKNRKKGIKKALISTYYYVAQNIEAQICANSNHDELMS